MASLQKKGENWYCQFMYGRQRHTYTIGKVQEDEAQATAARIDYLLMRVRQRLLEVPAGVDIVTFIEHDGKPPAPTSPAATTLFAEFRAAYLKTFGNGALEANTICTAQIHFKHLGVTLGEKFAMADLTLPHLQRHINRRQQDVAAVTIQKELATLRAAWNWACRMQMVQGSFPGAGLVYPKGDEKLPFMTYAEIERRIAAGGNPGELWECLYLTHAEIAALLDHVQKQDICPWIYPAFVFVAHTGTRRSEMMRARTEDLDLTARTMTIREKKRAKGRRTTRQVPLSTRLSELLTSWLQHRDGARLVFGHGSGILTPQTVHQSFERAVKDSKWEVLRGWHVLRHSFISALASQGVDQRFIDDFVGHQTEEQRRRYRHLYPSTQAEAIKAVFG